MNPTEPGFVVRLAGPEDLRAVLGVHARRDSGESPLLEASKTEVETWRQMLAVPGLAVYLAELDGDTVGTASAMLFPNITYDCHPTAIIEAVVVAHPYRRRGIATSLLRHLLEDMRSEAATRSSSCPTRDTQVTGPIGSTPPSGLSQRPRDSVSTSQESPTPYRKPGSTRPDSP